MLGPGQRGLASAIAAKLAGASLVIVTGLDPRSAQARLRDRARRRRRHRRRTRGPGAARARAHRAAVADVVVDVSADRDAAGGRRRRVVRPGGTIVLGGVKGTRCPTSRATRSCCAASRSSAHAASPHPATARRCRSSTSDALPLDRMRTHVFALAEAELRDPDARRRDRRRSTPSTSSSVREPTAVRRERHSPSARPSERVGADVRAQQRRDLVAAGCRTCAAPGGGGPRSAPPRTSASSSASSTAGRHGSSPRPAARACPTRTARRGARGQRQATGRA